MHVAIRSESRRPTLFWRRLFSFQLPESWTDIPYPERRKVFRANCTSQDEAARLILKKRIPRRWRRLLTAMDVVAMRAVLDRYLTNVSDCTQVALPWIRHKGVLFFLPEENGRNMACAEFAVADNYYEKMLKGDVEALHLMTYTLYRMKEKDEAAALRRGDVRVPFHSYTESAAMLNAYGPPPMEMQVQATMYMSGLKAWIHRVYGSWIFEQPDEDEESDESPGAASTPNGPDFGWWGILQAVAEGGVFGPLEQVYQSNLHEVCVYLVRKRQEADRLQAMTPSAKKTTAHDDLY